MFLKNLIHRSFYKSNKFIVRLLCNSRNMIKNLQCHAGYTHGDFIDFEIKVFLRIKKTKLPQKRNNIYCANETPLKLDIEVFSGKISFIKES